MGYQWPIRFTQDGSDWVGVHRPEFIDLRALFETLPQLPQGDDAAEPESWRKMLPAGCDFIRFLGPSAVQLHVKKAQVHDVVVKLVEPRLGGWRRLTETVRHSRSQRAFSWAHRLRAFGIETPRPLGYLETKKSPALHRSFHVTEHIDAMNLLQFRDDKLEKALEAQGRDAVLEKRSLIVNLARLTAKMHREGFFHGDLHGGNILVSDDGLHVIDLESMRRFRWPGRAVNRNLVRLNRDFLDLRLFSTSDRMRFVDTYLHTSFDRRGRRRELFRRIEAKTRLKLDERGEQFV